LLPPNANQDKKTGVREVNSDKSQWNRGNVNSADDKAFEPVLSVTFSIFVSTSPSSSVCTSPFWCVRACNKGNKTHPKKKKEILRQQKIICFL
jgi:hypothetical protein